MLNFDKGLSALSIGSTAIHNGADLDISALEPTINLFGEAFSDSMGIQYDSTWFNTYHQGFGLPFRRISRVFWSAPENSFVVDGGGLIGIGTASPAEAVDVVRSASAARFQLTSFTSTGNEAPQFVQRRALGTSGAPAAVTAGDNLGLFSFRGYTGTGFSGTKAGITVKATEPWSGSANGTRMLFQTTTNGTTALNTVLEITHDSKVKINGTELSVPDYVFEEDYQLMPLEELDSFIREHKHLPGVASAEEVKREGLDLGGSQLSVLEKVEELTLYTLQQHEQLLQQHEQLQALRTENAQLRSAYGTLQTRFAKVDQLEQMVNLLLQGEKSSPLLTSVSE
jgi:hypothetical protein